MTPTHARALPPDALHWSQQAHKEAQTQTPLPRIKAWQLALALLIGWAALPAGAQNVYRIVGPDGRITFSDQPPAEADARPVGGTSANTGTTANPPLPFVLRQVVSRYPVTLYTSPSCSPCNTGRNLLNRRGVPYVEKTITTPQDAEALIRISGQTSLPFLTIGAQQIKGFSDIEWTQFIDAAGYPPQSALPSNYRLAPATPLVAAELLDPTAPAPESNTPPAPNGPAIPVKPPTTSPSGIRF
jgi:glutaredoxin